MPGPAQPWDQSEDPRDQTVDLPRIDLGSYGNSATANGSAGSGRRQGNAQPSRNGHRRGSAWPAVGHESAGPADLPDWPEPQPRQGPDREGDPYARPGLDGSARALFEPDSPQQAGTKPARLEPAAPAPDTARPRSARPDSETAPRTPAEPAVEPSARPAQAQAASAEADPPDRHLPPASPAPLIDSDVAVQPPAPKTSATESAPVQPARVERERRTANGGRIRPEIGSRADLRSRLDLLPDGHPSSPYEDDGLVKAMPYRLKQLELGLPAPERENAEAGSTIDLAATSQADAEPAGAAEAAERQGTEGGRTGKPTSSRSAVDRHAARPAADQPYEQPASSRQDPVGERDPLTRPYQPAAGELSADEQDLVRRIHKACQAAEGQNVFGSYGESGLTPAIKRIAAQLDRGGLAPGSEANSLKSAERLSAKLARLIARHPDRSAEELAACICDVVRYAFAFAPDYYTHGTLLLHRKLKAHGFELEARRNRWESPEYKGIWTRWRDPAHDLGFEVQFHTFASWDVTISTHQAYLAITDPLTSPRDRAKLRAGQVAAFAATKPPPGSAEIDDFGRDQR